MTSTASTSGAKISMFGAKSGFVIPKNKLSGSLIPIFQRRNTLGGADTDNGVPAKLGKRKTKWGPDLTQDTAVKKGRVLAYQKRLDQIAQQLESGNLEAETSAFASLNAFGRSLAYQNNSDIAEQLEFEKREAIGEILELNPRYKAPPDYKPLLKEARLPIHVKEHSDFSSLSLLFGSQGDTQKRLEKETGAKVQFFGIKIGGEKVELCPSDEEFQTAWQELYFLISSDTYEKVDAAIAVVELLISSVSGNTGAGAAPPSSRSGDISTISGNSNENSTEPGFEQPNDSSVQPPQSQFQQNDPSFPLASNQVPLYTPPQPSAPILGNRIQDQELPTNSVNPNPPFAQQPLSIPYNTSLPPGSQVSRPQGLLPQPGFSTASPFYDNQIEPMGPRSSVRPPALLNFQHVPSNVFRPAGLPDVVSRNMAQSGWPLAPNFSPHPVAHQPGAELPSNPFPSSINVKHLVEYASGGSLRPMSVSAHITGRSDGPVPAYPSISTAPRPYLGDFGFLPQQSNTPQISSRHNSQSAHLPQLTFQGPSGTPPSQQHFGQSFARPHHFGGRQMDLPVPTQFHGNTRSSDLQNFGPPLPPRNFPGAQFPQQSLLFPPRPVFRHDNLMSSGRAQIHHQFNTGVHQVYDPFSPSDT